MNGATVLIKFVGDTKDVNSKMSGLSKATGSVTKGFIAGSLITKGLSTAFNMVSSSAGNAAKRLDTMNNFPKVMSNLGISAKDSQKSIKKLSDKLTGLPTSLDSAAASVQRFTSKNGDIAKSTDLFLAMNNAILAGGAPAEQQASAIEQLSQAYAKGKPDMMEWRSIQSVMPAQLKQIASAMGYAGGNADKLGEDLRSGKVSMDEFMGAIVDLNKNGGKNIKSFEEQARNSTGGIQTAIANMKTAITRGLANAFDAVDKSLQEAGLGGISGVINDIGKAFENVLKFVTPLITPLATVIKLLSGAGGDIGDIAKNLTTSSKKIVTTVSSVINKVIKTVQKVLPQIIKLITDLIPQIMPVLIQALIQIANAIVDAYPTIMPVIINGMMSLIDMIINALPSIITPLINGFINVLTKIVDMLPTIIPLLINALLKIFTALAEALPKIIPVLVRAIVRSLNLFIKAGMQIVFGIVKALPQIIKALIKALPQITKAIILGLATLGVELFKLAVQSMKDMWNGFKSRISTMWTNIKNFAKSIPRKIIEGIGNIFNIGKNIVQGIWNGMKNAKQWVLDKIKGLGKSILNGMKKVLGIKSPSKEFAIIGKFSVLGYTEALDKMKGDVQKQIDSTFGLSPTLTGTASTHYSPNVNVINNVNVKQDPLGQMVKQVKTFSGGSKNDYNYGMGV